MTTQQDLDDTLFLQSVHAEDAMSTSLTHREQSDTWMADAIGLATPLDHCSSGSKCGAAPMELLACSQIESDVAAVEAAYADRFFSSMPVETSAMMQAESPVAEALAGEAYADDQRHALPDEFADIQADTPLAEDMYAHATGDAVPVQLAECRVASEDDIYPGAIRNVLPTLLAQPQVPCAAQAEPVSSSRRPSSSAYQMSKCRSGGDLSPPSKDADLGGLAAEIGGHLARVRALGKEMGSPKHSACSPKSDRCSPPLLQQQRSPRPFRGTSPRGAVSPSSRGALSPTARGTSPRAPRVLPHTRSEGAFHGNVSKEVLAASKADHAAHLDAFRREKERQKRDERLKLRTTREQKQIEKERQNKERTVSEQQEKTQQILEREREAVRRCQEAAQAKLRQVRDQGERQLRLREMQDKKKEERELQQQTSLLTRAAAEAQEQARREEKERRSAEEKLRRQLEVDERRLRAEEARARKEQDRARSHMGVSFEADQLRAGTLANEDARDSWMHSPRQALSYGPTIGRAR